MNKMDNSACEPMTPTFIRMESYVPTRAELKTMFLESLLQTMARATAGGFDLVLRVVTSTIIADIKWEDVPAIVRDNNNTGVLVTALSMWEVESIEEACLLDASKA